MAFLNVLPDPLRNIKDSGEGAGGSYGPGFASVKVNSHQPTMVSRTNGGRVVTRSQATHYWSFDITYNPMTRDEFEPINSFLMSRQGRLSAFYIALPQYENPRSSSFATWAGNNNTVDLASNVDPGATFLKVTGMDNAATTSPKPGDLFNVVDSTNSNHSKAYMVTRVETTADQVTSGATLQTYERYIHFNPPLVYYTTSDATLDFLAPLVPVIQKSDVQSYSLGTDNLFQFSLSVEEALP